MRVILTWSPLPSPSLPSSLPLPPHTHLNTRTIPNSPNSTQKQSYEILLAVHGSIHPSVGTACLAVASVQSIVGNYQVSREWLVRGLRALEKLDPAPLRAVAFVQTQLSQVLEKQGHVDEALRVLDKAARFHLQQARDKLSAVQQVESGIVTTPHVGRGTALYDDAMQAVELLSRVVALSAQSSAAWAAAEQAEVCADLAESVFGWDSAVACDKRKESGDCYGRISDWARAHGAYRRAYDACEVLYGKSDSKTLACAKLIAATHGEMHGTPHPALRPGHAPASRLDAGDSEEYEQGHDFEPQSVAAADDDYPYSPRGRRDRQREIASRGAYSPTSSDLTLSPQAPGRKRG